MPTQRDYLRGKLFQLYRKEKGVSQKTLAIRVGVTEQTIYNLERGKGWLQIDNIAGICKVIDIDIKTLSTIDKECNCEDLGSDGLKTSLKDGSLLDKVRSLTRTNNREASSVQSVQENQ